MRAVPSAWGVSIWATRRLGAGAGEFAWFTRPSTWGCVSLTPPIPTAAAPVSAPSDELCASQRDRVIVATKAGYTFRDRGPFERAMRRAASPFIRRAKQSALAGTGTAARLAGRSYTSQDFSERYLRAALDASLRRLGTDYVDLYQLHAPRGVHHSDLIEVLTQIQSRRKNPGIRCRPGRPRRARPTGSRAVPCRASRFRSACSIPRRAGP